MKALAESRCLCNILVRFAKMADDGLIYLAPFHLNALINIVSLCLLMTFSTFLAAIYVYVGETLASEVIQHRTDGDIL